MSCFAVQGGISEDCDSSGEGGGNSYFFLYIILVWWSLLYYIWDKGSNTLVLVITKVLYFLTN